MCRGDIFGATLNVRLYNVNKYIFKVAVFTLNWFVGYTQMMLTELSPLTKTQWSNLKSSDGFSVIIMGEISDEY